MATITTRMQQRRDTTTNWAANNPVLLLGEMGYDTDLDRFKIGDGATAWTLLPFLLDAELADAQASADAAAAAAADSATAKDDAEDAQGAAETARDQAVAAATDAAAGLPSKLSKSSNLSDLANVATARTNLGLGDSATKNVGTAAGSVAAGNDARIVGAAQQASFGLDVTAPAYGADKSGATSAVAAIHAARDAAAVFGAPLYFPAGTYKIDGGGLVNNKPGQRWTAHPDAVFRLADGTWGAASTGIQTVVRLRASGAALIGGTIDVNRAGQDKTAYNAVQTSSGPFAWYGVAALGVVGTPLVGVQIDCTIINCVDKGAIFDLITQSDMRVTIRNSGGGVAISQTTESAVDAQLRSLDNDGWKVFPHAFDVNVSSDLVLAVDCTDHYGTGTASAGTSLSEWISGATFVDCQRLIVTRLRMETRQTDAMVKSVGFSALGIDSMDVSNMQIIGYTDGALELGGVTRSRFANFLIDCRYQSATNGPIASRGIALYNNAFYSDFTSRATVACHDLVFSNGLITRCTGVGIGYNEVRDVTWLGVRVTGTRRGLECQWTAADADASVSQPPTFSRALAGHRFIGCNFDYNENFGALIRDLRESEFIACSFSHNGQSLPFGAHRNGSGTVASDSSGMEIQNSVVPSVPWNKDGLKLVTPVMDGTPVLSQGLAVLPASPRVFSISDEGMFHIGQSISLAGAGVAGATLLARVNSIHHDEVTIDRDIATFPTVNLAGTIATSGVNVTGTGTAFLTDLTARYWLVSGGNVRQIIQVDSDTAAILASPFPADLAAGTTATIYKVTGSTIATQQYGLIIISTETIDVEMVGDLRASNNVVAAMGGGTLATALSQVGKTALAGKQPIDADLTAIAALASAADKMPYSTGAQAWSLTALTAFARTLLDDVDAATARGTLGVPGKTTTETISGAWSFSGTPPIVYSEAASVGYRAEVYLDAATAPQEVLAKARGTRAAPTAILNGDGIGSVSFRGHDGASFTGSRALLSAAANENWVNGATSVNLGGTGKHGCLVQLQITKRGDIAPTAAFQIDDALTSADTGMSVLVNNGSGVTLKRVFVGAADSGGAGYRLLRVTN